MTAADIQKHILELQSKLADAQKTLATVDWETINIKPAEKAAFDYKLTSTIATLDYLSQFKPVEPAQPETTEESTE